MHFATQSADGFLKMLFGKSGTDDWPAWAFLAATLLFLLLIRIKRHHKTCIGWGALILPLLAATLCTLYTLIRPRSGQAELALAGAALVVAVILVWQLLVRAFPKLLVVQIPLLLLALALTVTVGLDAVLNYQGLAISFSLGHVANVTSYAVAASAALSVVTFVIAFIVIVVRGIVRLVQKVNASNP